MIWVALYSTITFGLSIVVLISYLIVLFKNKRVLKEIKLKTDLLEKQAETRKEELQEMREIQLIINSEIYLDENNDIRWLKK